MALNSKAQTTVSVSLSFEKAQLPPFTDILLLGRKCPVGMSGITKSMEFLVPNNYDVIELDDPIAEAMVVNKSILKRMQVSQILEVLRAHVIPYMSESEIMRVDFTVRVAYHGIVVPA